MMSNLAFDLDWETEFDKQQQAQERAVFRTVVASDAVGGRAHGPHEANLFDMGQKYADLLSVGEIMAALRSHPESVMAGAKSA
jgi:hypothetical protein